MGDRYPLLAASLALVVLVGPTTSARAQPLPEVVPMETWGPSGAVAAITRHGNTLFVGGNFRYVGPGTGPFAAFAIDAAEPRVGATGFEGAIEHLVPLPGGGWIIAGDIREGASSARRIARLDEHGRLDPAFHVEVNGTVRTIASDGARVFLGGSLTAVNGIPRTVIAAVDARTGALLPWNPSITTAGFGMVTGLLLHQGDLYLVGSFTAVNSQPRTGFAALDIITGATLPLTQSLLSTIDAVAAAGDTVYLVGRRPSFEVGGLALSIATGQVLSWTLPAGLSTVRRLVATSTRVYASLHDTVRALDPLTGGLLGPPLVTSTTVDAMGASDDLLVIAHTRFGANATSELSTFDARTGSARAWSLRLDQRAEAIGIRDDGIALGGSFRSVGGVVRHNLFALDIRTGRPTAFAPLVQGEVAALAMAGDVLIAGGQFTHVDDAVQHGVAALRVDTGALLRWAPLDPGERVNAIAVAGNAIHLGGHFRVVDGHARPYLASVSLATGGVTAWLPVPDQPVHGLMARGDTVLAVGEFESLADGPRGRGASFSAATGRPTAWNPDADGAIWAVAAAGTTVGVVGSFSTLGSARRRGVGFLSESGDVIPLALAHDGVIARAIAGLGEHFFLGGTFTSGVTRHLIAVSTVSGLELWGPAFEDVGFGPDIRVVARYPDLLVAGGAFHRVSGRRVMGLALFPSPGATPPRTLRARVTGSLASVSWAAPTGTSPTSYIVEAGTSPGASNVGRFAVGGTAAAGTLAPGTYFVRVRAVVDGVEGQPSSEVILQIPAVPQPPQAPSGLSAFVASRTVSLSWTAAAGNVESYVIEAGLAPGQSNLAVFDTTTVDTVFSAPVAPGTYYVRIRARNSFGISPVSNEIQIVVP